MNNDKDLKGILVFFFFLALSIGLRLPYFFTDVIDWDESTFILLGQSILDGHLPYTETWDLKPPLLSTIFSLFIVIFGKSIFSIRMAGAFCVGLTSWLSYQIGKEIRSTQHGLIAGILTVVSLSLIHSDAPATMSEHVAIVPLMAGILMLIKRKRSLSNIFISGLLLTTAAMTRLNLAYVVVTMGVAITTLPQLNCVRKNQYLKNALLAGSCFSIGGGLVIGLTLLPYILTDQALLWWKSVVLAPLSFSGSRYTWHEALAVHSERIIDLTSDWSLIPPQFPSSATTTALLLLVGAILGLLAAVVGWRQYEIDQRKGVFIIGLAFVSTCASILKGGQAHFHYLFQICPFLALLAAEFYAALIKRLHLPVILMTGTFACVLLLNAPYVEYNNLIHRSLKGESLLSGPSYAIADYLGTKKKEDEIVFMTKYHIAYWLLNQKPPTPSATHPSTLAKDFLLRHSMYPGATPYLALKQVFDLRPEFIAAEESVSYLKRHPKAETLFKTTIQEDYMLDTTINNINIYQRKENR